MEVTEIIEMITKTAGDASKNIRIRVEYDFGDEDGDADIIIDTFHNKNNEGGCDKARTLLEEVLGVSDPSSVKEKPKVEEEIITPDETPLPTPAIQQIDAPAIAPLPKPEER